MNPMIVLRVGYMERYDGPATIHHGGGFVLENGVGGEVFNFKPSREKCYGFAMSTKFAGLDLRKIDPSTDWLPGDELSGVDVVFIARKPNVGQVVVGWYRDATVLHKRYRTRHGSIEGMDDVPRYFLCWAAAKSAHLLDDQHRTFAVPSAQAGHIGFPGQSNVWYPGQNVGDDGVRTFMNRLRKYMQKTSGARLGPDEDGAAGGGRRGRTRKPDHAHNVEVEKAAVHAVERHYEKLGYKVQSVEKENLGWDLYARRGGQVLHVEVKGVSNSGIYFELTPNEYKKLQEHHDRFRVCVVCDALTAPNVYELQATKNGRNWQLKSGNGKVVVALDERIAAVGIDTTRLG
jgi:hypothetical protein